SILLGFLLLFNEFAGPEIVVLLFSMWVLFAGIMRTVGAFTAKQNNIQGWGWILTIGLIGIVVGFIALFNPIVSVIGAIIVVATFFIVQGIGAIATFFFIGKNS
ncbi:DUF308 domain-containing protein, partial [Listeria seeligeri]|uniref:DUF308 domain-containing protein n=1 Tax=Listeria seeligeri TaxID=1640 RepID=UPI00188826C6